MGAVMDSRFRPRIGALTLVSTDASPDPAEPDRAPARVLPASPATAEATLGGGVDHLRVRLPARSTR